jgi:hypothetical protein
MTVQVAGNASILATAPWDGPVQIWNSDTGSQLTEFKTVFDNCNRLAIDLKGERIVAANWRKGKNGGIACYEIASGQPVWHRTDIGQVQDMQFSPREDRVWCRIDGRPVHCFDAWTGATLATVRGAESAFDSPFTSHTFFFRHKDLVLEAGENRITMPRLGFFYGGAFSHDAVCVAEMAERRGNPQIDGSFIRCFEVANGKERWHYICPDDHYIQLVSYQNDGFLYCVVAAGQQGRVERKTVLLRLTLESGSCTEMCELHSAVCPYFGGFGNGILVTPTGDVISLKTGAVVRRLPF